jgi:hypothetical protein
MSTYQSVMKGLHTNFYDKIINKRNIHSGDIVKTVTYSQSSCGNTAEVTGCNVNSVH